MPVKSETAPGGALQRKPWKKKTPVEVVFEQTEKLRQDIVRLENELKDKKKQLTKFEEARRIFEQA